MKIQTIGHTWLPNNDLSPHIIESRYCVLPQVKSPKRSCYPYWVLDYDFTSGCDYRLDREKLWKARPAGQIHIYPPHTVYWEKPKAGIKYTDCSWLLLSGRLNDCLGEFVKIGGHGVFEDNDGKVGLLLKSAANMSQQQGQDAYWQVHAILTTIFDHLTHATHVIDELWRINPQNSPENNEGEFVMTVNNYLRTHLTEKISIDMIAEEIGIGVSSLAHRYRKETGTTPIASLIEMRTELAKTLLRRGYKLKYIAEHTGFSDEYHLAKTFKKITGQTPSEFKNKAYV